MLVPPSCIPARVPCEWSLDGNYGDQTSLMASHGISNRQVVIIIQKDFTNIERLLAKLLKAPKSLRRPLDRLNSALWELMDGTRTFDEIVHIMQECYNEDIVPANERCSSSVSQLVELNLVTVNN